MSWGETVARLGNEGPETSFQGSHNSTLQHDVVLRAPAAKRGFGRRAANLELGSRPRAASLRAFRAVHIGRAKTAQPYQRGIRS
jgi:hypothetical protein